MEAVAENKVIAYRRIGDRAERTAWLGMLIFLGSWAMMFAALFLSYGLVRARSPVWPPLDEPLLPKGLPLANTAVIALSSLVLWRALAALEAGRSATLRLAGATALGALFLALQLVVWVGMWRQGLTIDVSPYSGVFYGLTIIHALHVLVGLVALAVLAVRARLGALGPARTLPLRLWSLYWHFVGGVWLFMFVTVYLV